MNLFDNGNENYKAEIVECVSALEEALEIVRISNQLKSYIVWLIHRAYMSNIIGSSLAIDFDKFADELIDDVSSLPIEIGLWILSNCLDIGTTNDKVTLALEKLISHLSPGDLWAESTKSAFLVFTSSVLKRTDSCLTIPYTTFSIKETPFFGIVSETLLKGAFDLEKEKKTIDFDENSLRNRFLAILKTRFEGLATSETFRCKGLTDIIVTNPRNHYEEIIIECKIWRGKKYYHQAIDQAIGYLTKSENRVIILVFFKAATGRWTIEKELVEAVESKARFIGSSRGIISLATPTHFTFGEHYLFSWQGREDGTKVGIHHIFVNLSH